MYTTPFVDPILGVLHTKAVMHRKETAKGARRVGRARAQAGPWESSDARPEAAACRATHARRTGP